MKFAFHGGATGCLSCSRVPWRESLGRYPLCEVDWLIRMIAGAVVRPVERWWRRRDDAQVDDALPATLRISDLNRGLVPLGFLVLVTAFTSVITAGMILSDKPEANLEHWTDTWPFAIFGAIIIGLAIWTFLRPLWVEVTADAILVRRLASERQYGPAELRRCAFELSPELWGPLPPRQETGETRCKFRFADGVQFEATLGVRKARLLHSAVDRLTRGAGRWIAEDPDAAAYAQNPIRLTSRALEGLRKAARKAGLGGRAVVLAGVQPSPDDSDGFIYQLDLVEGVPPGSILTESVGRLIAVEREDAALLAGVIIDFNRGAGGTGFLFIRTDTPDTPALAV